VDFLNFTLTAAQGLDQKIYFGEGSVLRHIPFLPLFRLPSSRLAKRLIKTLQRDPGQSPPSLTHF